MDLGKYAYKLIYASVKHGIGEEIFKKMCHGHPNLLCLIQSESNDVFGGYTSCGWPTAFDEPYGHSQGVDDDKSFVFSIRSIKGYKPAIFDVIEPKHSLWFQEEYYLMFAGSCVIYVDAYGKGHAAAQPERYETYPYDSYLANTSFKVKSIEVFQLQKD